jgi:hypothetical protein
MCQEDSVWNCMRNSPSGQFDPTLFTDIEKTVIASLNDTWSRFIVQGSYVRYIAKQKSEREMIGNKFLFF